MGNTSSRMDSVFQEPDTEQTRQKAEKFPDHYPSKELERLWKYYAVMRFLDKKNGASGIRVGG